MIDTSTTRRTRTRTTCPLHFMLPCPTLQNPMPPLASSSPSLYRMTSSIIPPRHSQKRTFSSSDAHRRPYSEFVPQHVARARYQVCHSIKPHPSWSPFLSVTVIQPRGPRPFFSYLMRFFFPDRRIPRHRVWRHPRSVMGPQYRDAVSYPHWSHRMGPLCRMGSFRA